jgi:uncharacterized repeat protein (TIGR01451 family)
MLILKPKLTVKNHLPMKKLNLNIYLALLALLLAPNLLKAQCQAYFGVTYQPNGVVIFNDSSNTGGSVNNQYLWTFGDGISGSGSSTVHTYSNAGTYQACLILSTQTGCIDTFCLDIYPTGSPCNLAVTAVPDANFSVVNAVATGGTPPYQYSWNTISPYSFDTLLSAGNYCVTVYDANGCTATNCFQWGGVNCNPVVTYNQVDSNTFIFAYSMNPNVSSFVWDFGDGNTSTNTSTVQNSYATPGTYTVTLTAYVNGIVCGTYTTNVTVTGIAPGSCQAFYFVNYQSNGVTIFMDSSNVGSSTNNQYVWDFGDGTTGSGPIFTHVYSGAGPYVACLTLSTQTGCVDTFCTTIYPLVGGCNMTVNVTPDTNNVLVYANVTGGTAPYTYGWNTISSFSFDTLLSNGNYCVTVYDANGCTASSCYNYTGSNNCQCVFTYIMTGQGTYAFVPALGGNVTNWIWDFGDGNTSVAYNPTHTYTAAGNYVVTLTAYNNGVLCGSSSMNIFIQGIPNTYLCGYYFNDVNMNGLLDAGETGVSAGLPNSNFVTVFGLPGTINSYIPDSTGFYSMALPAGTYTIQVCPNTNGWSLTLPADTGFCASYTVTLNPNDSLCGFNFGVASTNGIIAGHVFYDANNNGVKDGNENGIPYQMVQIGNGIVWTNAAGYYFQYVPVGTYSISYTIGGNYVGYTMTTASPQTANVSTVGMTYGGFDFGIYLANGTINLGVTLDPHTTVTPGFPAWYDIDVCNYGNVSTGATVTLYYDQNLSLNYSNPNAASNNTTNNIMVWNLPALAPGACTSIWVSFDASTTVPLGYPALTLVTVDPTVGNDAFPANNLDTTHQITVGSWDPNNKLVTRTNTNIMSDQYAFGIDSDQELNYTVNFQNTGTAPAVNVIVEDIISANADLNTFTVVSTSHNCIISRNGNQVSYQFPGIMLPDSTNNEPQSHGYIKYKVNALSSLNIGEQLSDYASIYFDFNAPVITNNAVVTIVGLTGMEQASTAGMSIAPVPVKDNAQLRLQSNGAARVKVEMLSIEGKVLEAVYEGSLTAGQHWLNIPCEHLSNGFYFVRLTQNDVVQVEKIAVQH